MSVELDNLYRDLATANARLVKRDEQIDGLAKRCVKLRNETVELQRKWDEDHNALTLRIARMEDDSARLEDVDRSTLSEVWDAGWTVGWDYGHAGGQGKSIVQLVVSNPYREAARRAEGGDST